MAGLPAPLTQDEVDEDPAFHLPTEPEELETFLSKINIHPAPSSTDEYYRKHKDLSYPVNLQSDTRGRAVVFTMTRNRPGWNHDVWNLNKMFKSLNIKAKYVFNSTIDQTEDELKTFVTDKANDDISYCFLVFMGHGLSKHGYDVCMELSDGLFDIANNCEFICGRRSSKVKIRPKIFLVQACREKNVIANVQSTVCLRNFSVLNDYLFVNACQPGQKAFRQTTGSRFVEIITESIRIQAHNKHIEDINKRLLRWFNSRKDEQMPQYMGSMPYFMNLFPGITANIQERYIHPRLPIQESNGNSNGSDSHKPEKKAAASRGSDMVPESEKVRNKYDIILKVEDTTPNTEELKNDALHNMKTYLCQSETKQLVEQCLSAELETNVSVTEVTEGSVIVGITLDETVAKLLVPLSDSGMLSRKLQTVLVTADYLSKCTATEVQLSVVLSPESMRKLQPVVEISVGHYATYIAENVVLSAISPVSEKYGSIQWYKDNEPIDKNVRRTFKIENDRCKMEIKDVVGTDAGKYKCSYIGKDNRNYINDFYIEVLNDELRKEDAMEDVKLVYVGVTFAEVRWRISPCKSLIKYYKVESFLESVPDKVTTTMVENSSCILQDLIPGQSYRVCVIAVFDDKTESWPFPVYGLRFYTNIHLNVMYEAHSGQIKVWAERSTLSGRNLTLVALEKHSEEMSSVLPISHGKGFAFFNQQDLLPGSSYEISNRSSCQQILESNVVIRQAPGVLMFLENNKTVSCKWIKSKTLLVQKAFKYQVKKKIHSGIVVTHEPVREMWEDEIQVENMQDNKDVIILENTHLKRRLLPGAEYEVNVAVVTLEGTEVWFEPLSVITEPNTPHIESFHEDLDKNKYQSCTEFSYPLGGIDFFLVEYFVSIKKSNQKDKYIFTQTGTTDTKTELSISIDRIKELSPQLNTT